MTLQPGCYEVTVLIDRQGGLFTQDGSNAGTMARQCCSGRLYWDKHLASTLDWLMSRILLLEAEQTCVSQNYLPECSAGSYH